jgi:hypothetical protein
VHPQRRPDAERPDGAPLRQQRDAGRRDVRPRYGFRPDGACPGKERTGCYPDAGDVRCRRRGPGACPGTWRRGCYRDGDRPDGVLNPDVPAQPVPRPSVPAWRRAWRPSRGRPEPGRREQPEPGPQGQPERRGRPVPEQPVPGQREPGPQGQPERRGPLPVLRPWAPQPWGRRGQARAPCGALRGWRMPWVPTRVLRTSKLLLRRGMRCGVSSQRGPQWLKRRSERIRPVPAVLSLHLWK